MRNTMIAGALALGLVGSTGCATKKYVAKSIAPVETHVSAVETKNDAKNADQDKVIAQQGNQAASGAQRTADTARSSADQAQQGVVRLERTIDAMNKYQMTKSVT